MAKKGIVWLCLVAVVAWPTLAQDIFVGGEVQVTYFVPSSVPAAKDRTRIGLGPDSVLNLEANVRENLTVYWELNLAQEVDSATADLVTSPYRPSAREQHYLRLSEVGGRNGALRVGKFWVPFGLRDLDREDRLFDVFDTGFRYTQTLVSRPNAEINLGLAVTDGYGGSHPQYYLGCDGRSGRLDLSADVAWGNGKGLVGVSGAIGLLPNDALQLKAEYLNGDLEDLTTEEQDDLTLRSLYLEVGYQFPDSPFRVTFKVRDQEVGPNDTTEFKYGLHYALAEDLTVKVEYWDETYAGVDDLEFGGSDLFLLEVDFTF
ncbi:MAG TPA: hypothetical protein EYP85_17275 [Armatimonadetes bacterium]|nr:hypothetical protein [Armatimonadota bacterium]